MVRTLIFPWRARKSWEAFCRSPRRRAAGLAHRRDAAGKSALLPFAGVREDRSQSSRMVKPLEIEAKPFTLRAAHSFPAVSSTTAPSGRRR